MNSPSTRSSPSFKHLKLKNNLSPIEIKEKIRKSYREKVHSCRSLLLNSFRGIEIESGVRSTLDDIYKSTFDFTEELTTDEEDKLLEEIREELVQEELNWWLEEHDKNHSDFDINSMEAEHVICPVCQKANFTKANGNVLCQVCNIQIESEKSLSEIKLIILNSVERHGSNCSTNAQFSAIPDVSGTHIYLMCGSCNEIYSVV